MVRRYLIDWAESADPAKEDLPTSLVRSEDYDALAARLAEAERDAARYRWLRDNAKRTMLMRLPASYEPDAIDRTIDAARAADSAPAANPHCLNDGTPCAPDGSGGCTACSRTFSADACTCPGTLTPEVHYTGCPAAQEE